jgi:uridine phosphorylase
VFTVDGLLREARRQKSVPPGNVPEICLLDPDGDLSRDLKASGGRSNPHWACYHTEMVELATPAATVGVVGCAVGASFAVLVAEELFASGCQLLISITSAGQVVPAGEPPYFVLIDRAWRDEGTSHHYLPPAPYAYPGPGPLALADGLATGEPHVIRGGTWTTDAPFRETEEALAAARAEGLLAVEMEAAALYAFAQATQRPVLCFAHVTNRMATVENDFEKGEANGNRVLIDLVSRVTGLWGARP